MSVRDATERLRAARAAGFDHQIVWKLAVEVIEEMGRSHLEQAAQLQRLSDAVELALRTLLDETKKLTELARG